MAIFIEVNNISDIDISLTPLTNTLPINRLQLKDGEQQIIEAIYFDIFERIIKPAKQITRLQARNIFIRTTKLLKQTS